MQNELLSIHNDHLYVDIAPTIGADIRRISRVGKNENLLLETRWGGSEANRCSCSDVSEEHFLTHYAGGWQLMIPNAGFPSLGPNGNVGYHGEAWSRAWEVLNQEPSSVSLRTMLTTSPIVIQRTVSLRKKTLEVTDEVSNSSGENIEFIWGNHPAFSTLLIDETTEVFINAQALEIAESTLPIVVGELPAFLQKRGDEVYLNNLLTEPYSFLGFATKFKKGRASILSHKNLLRLDLSWDCAIFPHAWLWIENTRIAEKPWNSSVRTLAIEPCSTKTNMGLAESLKSPGNVVSLKARESKSSSLFLELIDMANELDLVDFSTSAKEST